MESTNAIPATEGYAVQATYLIARYEALSFEAKHEAILGLLPSNPSRVIDIGSGTGLDAAWLASKGHHVVAVEPVNELREAGRRIHSMADVTWVKDSLPFLSTFDENCELFDVAMLTAVWMHLDEKSRHLGMRRISSLIAPDGLLCMTLRHGPLPEGRQTFDVSADETISLAVLSGFETIANVRRESVGASNRAVGIMWSHLVFRFSPRQSDTQ
jgi:SAM-dependent methyltransferase